MILKLLLAYIKSPINHITNIELERNNNILIPIDVAFAARKNITNVFDLCVIDIGSFDTNYNHDFDIFRISPIIIKRDNVSAIIHYKRYDLDALVALRY